MPIGSRKARIRLRTVNHFGSNSTYCFDDVALEIGIQEEAQPGLGDLADVDTVTKPPVAGDTLTFDGTTWAPGARQVEIIGGVEGAPAADQVILRYVATRSLSLPAGLVGSQAVAGVAATAQADSDVRNNGTSVGTIRFSASTTVASFSSASAVTLAGGDVLSVVAPAAPDATLADAGVTLIGVLD